jgi:hypothetical protein
MPDLFWQSRLRKQEKAILRSLPSLPDDIDDSLLVTLSVDAAIQDAESRSYDHFLFSEDGFKAMPWEKFIDQLVELHIQRAPERESKELIGHELKLVHWQKKEVASQVKIERAQAEVEQVEALVKEEALLLSGEKLGEDGLNWEGVAPDTSSKSRHVGRRFSELLVLLLVGAVDAIVAYFSLANVMGDKEAWYLLAPVIGVQVLFPYLTGRALAQRNRGATPDKYRIVLFASAVSWILYAFAMTYIRFQVLLGYLDKTDIEDTPAIEFTLLALSFFLLIGFGLWVMLRTMKSNPHEMRFSRLKFILVAKNNKLERKRRLASKVQGEIENAQSAIERIKAAWSNRRSTYTQAGIYAKQAYRRALVNTMRDIDFTTSYLENEQVSLKRVSG